MMTRKITPGSTPLDSAKGRASNLILLLLIFALTTGASMCARLVFARSKFIDANPAELEQARREAQAAIPRLPADTEDRLATALYPQLPPIANVSDPFVDRAGVVNLSGARNGSSLMVRTRATKDNQFISALSDVPAMPALLSRLQSWQQSVRSATVAGQLPPPITTAYLHTEIAPTGRIDTLGRHGAWFYIPAEKRTLAAAVGAKFYDAVLVSIVPDGVVFRLQNGSTKTVAWDREEDLAIATAAAARSDGQQAQPTASPEAKPIGEEQNNKQQNSPSGSTSLRTSPQTDQPPVRLDGGEFDLLQDAVRARYPKRKPALEPRVGLQKISSGTNTVRESVRARTFFAFDRAAPSQESPTPERKIATVTYRREVRPGVENAHARVDPSISPAIMAAYYREEDTDTPFNTDVNALDPIEDELDEPIPSPSPTPSPALSPVSKATVAPTPEPSTAVRRSATPSVPASIEAAETSVETKPQQIRGSLCDPQFHGENITITNESNRPITLLNFVNKLNEAYSANIVLDYDVQDVPVRLNITNAPWTSVLRTLLDLNDLDLVCLDGRIVQIAKRNKIAQMEDGRRKMAPLVREVFKLRYLQPTAGGRVNLAGVTQSSAGATIQSIEEAIRAILKAGGDTRGEARRVPGRNEIFVAATREQMAEIRDLIARVDRPGYQVLVKALVYTANENRLRDIGSQLSLIVGNGGQSNLGGFTTLPRSSQNNNGSGNGNGTGNGGNNSFGLNPGGVPSLGDGFRPPTGSLGGASPLGTFGVSGVFGTAQVAYQLTLAQQRGVINIQSRPFGIVSDGDTFDLVAGTQIPVVTTTIAGGAPFQSGNVQFIEASRIARITPQVAETEDGKPGFVTLQIQLENNSVDTSLGTFNGVPGVNRQSLQTVMRLRNGETAIVGGLAADTVSNATSKVPGIGDVPLFGNLFKRKTNQENRDRLYFAITVEVISQESPLINVPAPSDAMTTPPPPPRAQRPSPFQKK
jgi:Flp pilus assembly secretin CpaC